MAAPDFRKTAVIKHLFNCTLLPYYLLIFSLTSIPSRSGSGLLNSPIHRLRLHPSRLNYRILLIRPIRPIHRNLRIQILPQILILPPPSAYR